MRGDMCVGVSLWLKLFLTGGVLMLGVASVVLAYPHNNAPARLARACFYVLRGGMVLAVVGALGAVWS